MVKHFYLLFCFICFTAFSQNLNDHLLLHYTFDGDTNDISGNGYDGVPIGVSYGLDRFGNTNSACYFNGVDNYVNFPNLAVLKPNLPVSFSFWVKYQSDDFNNQVVFNTSFEENRCTGVWFNSSLSVNGHAINFGDGSYFYSPQSRSTFLCYKEIELNVWRHIIVVVNSEADMKMFIDCLDNPGFYSGTGGSLVYSETPGCIGRHDRDLNGPPGYFSGLIDDFMYWDRALTIEDVAVLCNYLSVPETNFQENELVISLDKDKKVLQINTNTTGIMQISIYNSIGQQLYSNSFSSTINVDDFASGLYFVSIKTTNAVLTKKVIIP